MGLVDSFRPLTCIALRGDNPVLRFAFATVTVALACLGLSLLLTTHARAIAAGIVALISVPAI